MTSNINYLGINENFPVPGQDNDTQVFRDNFDTIKNSLRIARDEMTDLQDNAARTDLDNDFNNKVIQRAVFLNNADKRFHGGSPISSNYTVDYEVGNYQIFIFNQNTVIEFQNFPDDNSIQRSAGKVILELYSDGAPRNISFATSGGAVIKTDKNFPSPLTLISNSDPIFIEVWRHSTNNIYIRLITDLSEILKEDLPNSGASSLKTEISYFSTDPVASPATSETATLAAGREGQIKTFVMFGKNSSNMDIFVTNPGWGGSGTITFNTVGQACTLQYVNGKWFCIGNNGAEFS